MSPGSIRLYNSTGPDRVAVVTAEPTPRGPFVHVRRGGQEVVVLGPFDPTEFPGRYSEVVEGLRAEGFGPPGLPALLESLQGTEPRTRARAALRLGWRKEQIAVPIILGLLPNSIDELCPLLDALGAIGDPRGVPAIRDYATRKLLSRRRSAVEALRAIGDAEGLTAATVRAREQLPAAVRSALDADENPEHVARVVLGLDSRQQGLALDNLYEIGTRVPTRAVLISLDALTIDQPYLWRYVKSIYKRSMLRHDDETFGALARTIEARGRVSQGTEATVKSGHDGIDRSTPIFRRKTRDYLRGLGWRYLTNLARHRPELYPKAAAAAVAAYRSDDPEEPEGTRGAFARCYLWHRVLLGGSDRFQFDDRRLVFRFRDAKSTRPSRERREESWPELWDAYPLAYLQILQTAHLPEAHAFALQAMRTRHPHLIESAKLEQVITLLDAPVPETVALGLTELDRRFAPDRPDLPLLDRLLCSSIALARELGHRWLRLSSPLWTLDQEWVLTFLGFPDAETASLAGELAARSLGDRPALRRELAARLLTLLRSAEPTPGTHDVYAQLLGEALADETSALLSVTDLINFCQSGSPPLQSLAGRLLAQRPEATLSPGTEGLITLANHEIASVRSAAHALLRANVDAFRADPSPLFLLVESDWRDTRDLAFETLRDYLGFESLGLDGLLGLLDSHRPDVREFGRALTKTLADRVNLRTLVRRLAEHPAPDTRRLTLDLAATHLPEGAEALRDFTWFFRAVLLDLRPDRLLKRRVLDFLLVRGRRDLEQADFAARLFAETARLAVRADAEHAREAIARLALAWPDLILPPGVLVNAECVS